jgi:hypothetical protein
MDGISKNSSIVGRGEPAVAADQATAALAHAITPRKERVVNVFHQLKSRMNTDSDFDGGVYVNKKGVEFRVINENLEDIHFYASAVIKTDILFGNGDLKFKQIIYESIDVYWDVENVSLSDLWEEDDGSYEGENDVFRFECLVGYMDTSLLANPAVRFESGSFECFAHMLTYTVDDFYEEYQESLKDSK